MGASIQQIWEGVSIQQVWEGVSIQQIWDGVTIEQIWEGVNIQQVWEGAINSHPEERGYPDITDRETYYRIVESAETAQRQQMPALCYRWAVLL